ncbi:MAG TPA: thiolase family protein [Candidatus Brocadiales bacterium]|nr:thiolase family protein [Candidatus Brocadiales bacterium]
MANIPVILSAARTPIGGFGGSLSQIPATQLGALAARGAIQKSGIKAADVEQVIMGNVLSAGLGQSPARQVALGCGLPVGTNALTVNKVCGSGLKAVMLGAQAILCGDAEVVLCGGMECMSRAPYLLEEGRWGYRIGHGSLVDSMIKDGLWDVYNNFHMGHAAELIAEKYRISRKEADDLALQSYERAVQSQRQGDFREEIIPIEMTHQGKKILVSEDDCPKRLDRDKMAALSPVFKEGGVLTAANSSALSDGAAAVVLATEDRAKELGVRPMARVLGYSEAAMAPELFSLAPVEAINKLLRKLKLDVTDINLFEINEAFASTCIAIYRELGLDLDKVNVRGGAIALGHPIGASGARILTTLLYALSGHPGAGGSTAGRMRGIASLCIGGGEAVALAVEMM